MMNTVLVIIVVASPFLLRKLREKFKELIFSSLLSMIVYPLLERFFNVIVNENNLFVVFLATFYTNVFIFALESIKKSYHPKNDSFPLIKGSRFTSMISGSAFLKKKFHSRFFKTTKLYHIIKKMSRILGDEFEICIYGVTGFILIGLVTTVQNIQIIM